MTEEADIKATRIRALITPILGLVAVIAIAYWIHQRSIHVYTDDARVASDMILISTKVLGLIEQLPIKEGDVVQKGDLIMQLDLEESRLKLAELQALLEATQISIAQSAAEKTMVERQTGGQLQAAQSQLEAVVANLSSAGTDLDQRQSEWERANSLREKNLLSQQDWELARGSFHVAQQTQNAASAMVASARAKLVEAQAARERLIVLELAQQRLGHERDKVMHQVARAQVVLTERQIVAPLPGIIDQTFTHAGEYIMPGQRVALMHNPQDVWVKANIRETEMRHIVVGQPVELSVDAYPDRKFMGEVERIGHAATSQFALLPSTNPSGNFTKVTQRLPVKIRVQQEGELLRPGMMVEVAIDIR
jgi:membrane fusion protein (multidrug efflux system)